jgi:hypothetical protein
MNLKKSIGLDFELNPETKQKWIQYINLKLSSMGCPTFGSFSESELGDLAGAFLSHLRETDRLLSNYLCPADHRVQSFIYDYLQDVIIAPKLPSQTFVLDRHGLARLLSLPADQDHFTSDIVHSFRVRQGVLHNPKNDRRTTQGSFHIAEGGLSIPDDKLAVPKHVYGNMLRKALNPPPELLRLPFTSSQEEQAECFVSLLLRPVVCPAVEGFTPQKSMEIRFFAPGNLVGNLDFVESIFGNAGDPYLPENDSGLDVERWTGHTGCVILAPHLIQSTKKELGLPHFDMATERQRRDGMCWKLETDRYNNGNSFKLTARDASGTIVTLIADNYFGYCKKEVKTQISFSANLFGLAEEEHAGGALVFPSYDLGEEFSGDLHVRRLDHTFAEASNLFSDVMQMKPEGYAIDKNYPDIVYVPEDVFFDLQKQTASWKTAEGTQSIKILPGHSYVRPSGYKVHMEKPSGNRAWRLIGTVAEGTFCHKPCTVSGGGKSEISKPITDAFIQGPVFVSDFKKDFDRIAELINRDYSNRFKNGKKKDSRPILSGERSLGSVIKLLSPSSREYTQEYNDWLQSVPQYIKELLFVVKRFYKPEWDGNWREHFGVDIINGTPGNELKCDNRKLVSNYLRVGFEADGLWRVFGLRKDFHPAFKIAREDDISASVVVPSSLLKNLNPDYPQQSMKFAHNCEYRLFQRPDDAIHRGYDKQTEADFAKPGNFFSNYEPLNQKDAQELLEDSIGFDKFTAPIQDLIRASAHPGPTEPIYFVSSAHPRIVDGKPSKNPRYLQIRPDLLKGRDVYLTEIAARLRRRLPMKLPLYTPVNATLPGRRNNPPEPAAGIRSLAVHNPIHYMELPELFMEYISSMTGKSPSTTGAGSEGALTKSPFNALAPIIDLNNAFVAYALCGHDGFVTAAGYVGPNARVDHDVSLLIPELWSRMLVSERDPQFLIKNGYLERCKDFKHQGKPVLAGRLGYRITRRFVTNYFGRIFNHPASVFTEEMLKPELQDLATFADGMDNILATHKRVAQMYFDDGSIEMACPPLKALLHIMAHGQWEGKDSGDEDFRKMFTRDYVLQSPWYAERLAAKQKQEFALWNRHIDYLKKFLGKTSHVEEAKRLRIAERLENAKASIDFVKSPGYMKHLEGSLGLQPLGS